MINIKRLGKNLRKITFIISLGAVVLLLTMSLSSIASESNKISEVNNDFIFTELGPIERSRLYADGSNIDLQTETVTKPMCGSNPIDITPEEFKNIMLSARETFMRDPEKIVISGDSKSRGLNIIFYTDGSVPPSAVTALNTVASYIEGMFNDDITATINVDFENMGSGILGGTSSSYAGYVTWTNTRNGLQNDMDGDDIIQDYLPTGSTIPVRYDGSSGTVTNENRCYFTKANYRATIGSVSGTAAWMTFNNQITWDYNPSNGVSGYCFQSVAAHEVGHVLGFTSGVDFRFNDIEALDIYRFQRTDGGYDYNPDTYSEFQTRPRLVDYNNPNDDHNSDIITNEYRMEDGNPYQASHFRTSVNGIMDPNLAWGETFYPNYYRTSDLNMFDAIGWDYPIGANNPPYIPSNPSPSDGATNVDINVDLSWTGGDPDSGDTVTYDVYLEANDSTPDILVSDDQSGTTYDPGALNYDTHYFWQIVAEDNHGLTATGPVWDFWTEESPDITITIWSSQTEVPRNSNFIFNVQITNNEPTSHTVKVWTAARRLPGGSMIEPIKGPVTINLNPGQTRTFTNTPQYIGSIPLATYRYYARVGENCPQPLWAEDYWDLTVIP